MDIVKFLADGTLLLIIAIGGYVALRYMPWAQWRTMVPRLVMAGLTSLWIAKLLSLVYQPSLSRPFIERGVGAGAAFINNPGFPSDHMLLAVVIVGATYMVSRRRAVLYGMAVMAIVMGVARVVALVHTPLDIVGGIVCGLFGMLWYITHERHI